MAYGLWFLLLGNLGRAAGFGGWFDAIMVFFFYIPNLIVAEAFIGMGRKDRGRAIKLGAATLLLVASLFVIGATWMFTARGWGPRIIGSFA